MKPKFNPQEIAALFRRFMDGQTTLAEEDVLARYFAEADTVPAEWADYKRMFDYLADNLTPQEGAPNAESTPAKPRRRRTVRLWMSAAAVAAVVVLAVVLMPTTPQTETLAVAQPALDTPTPAEPAEPAAPVEPKAEPQPEPRQPKIERRRIAQAKPSALPVAPTPTTEPPTPDEALLATATPPAEAQTELANQQQMVLSGMAQQEHDYTTSHHQAQNDYDRAMQAIEAANIRIDRQRHTLTIYSVAQDGQLRETVLI